MITMKNYDDNEYIARRKTCGNWCCPECGAKKGKWLRKILHTQKMELFIIPKLFTFTVNPSAFDSPLQAYRFVRDKNFIPRMMRYMHIKKWVCVLECQKNGFPHWHIIADISDLKEAWIKGQGESLKVCFKNPDDKSYHHVLHYVNMKQMHKLWRKWGIGEQVDFSRKKGRKNKAHCFNYITKYLIKNPENGFPQWLLDEEKVCFVSASKAVGSLFGSKSVKSESAEKEENEDEERHASQIYVRVAACGLKTDIIEYDEGRYRYVTTINIPLDKLLKLKPDDFYKKKVFDEVKANNYIQIVMKRKRLDFWLNLCENEESDMLFNNELNKRFEQMGIAEPF